MRYDAERGSADPLKNERRDVQNDTLRLGNTRYQIPREPRQLDDHLPQLRRHGVHRRLRGRGGGTGDFIEDGGGCCVPCVVVLGVGGLETGG